MPHPYVQAGLSLNGSAAAPTKLNTPRKLGPPRLLSHIIRCYMCNEPDAKHRDRGHQDVKHVFRDISFKEFLQDIALS